MDYKELLKAEIQNRMAQNNTDQNAIRGLLNQTDNFKNIPPEMRTDYRPAASLVDTWTGSNLARVANKPDTVKDDIRKQLAFRMQIPKFDNIGALSKMASLDKDSIEKTKDVQRMRESMMKSKEGISLIMNNKLLDKARQYQNLVNKYGYEVAGPDAAELEGAYREFQIAYKNAAELGVIAGPDMMLIEGVAPPATGFKGVLQNKLKGGNEGINQAINQLYKSRQSEMEKSKRVLNYTYPNLNIDSYIDVNRDANSNPDSIEMEKLSEEQLKKLAGY